MVEANTKASSSANQIMASEESPMVQIINDALVAKETSEQLIEKI